MLSFFRLNDPYRLIFIGIILLIPRLIYWLFYYEPTLPELNWILIGEKLAAGDLLYKDLYEDIAPLSGAIYTLLFTIFGKNYIAFQVIAYLLLLSQCATFNYIVISHKAYKENTYLPALLFALLASCHFDLFTLSPVLMGQFFIFFALKNVYVRMGDQSSDAVVLKTGSYIGIAALFHFPLILFLFPTLATYALFTGTILRRYFLLLLGCLVVLAWVWFGYFFFGYESYLYRLATNSFIPWNTSYISFYQILIVYFVPILFLIVAYLKVSSINIYTNYQVRIQHVMLFFLITSALTWVFLHRISIYQFLIFIPYLSFFISHYLLNISKLWKGEFALFLLLANVSAFFIFSSKIIAPKNALLQYKEIKVAPTRWDNQIAHKNILVLGNDISAYKNSTLATPYLNWRISKNELVNINTISNLKRTYLNLQRDPPEVIIDEFKTIPSLFNQMPKLAKKYHQLDSVVWVLKKE